MTIIPMLLAILTLLLLGLVLYLVYLETAIDLPPSDHSHHRKAAHGKRPVQNTSDVPYARRIA